MTHPPATDARASDDPLSTDLELEPGACYFWYKVYLIKTGYPLDVSCYYILWS